VVGHASQVLAFSPDGSIRVVYPFGTRQADWKHDIPLLAAAGSNS
jgi:protein SCO1/2